eukprot:GEMP01009310.1.p1 GENE.GEMP01009310.1~~GEMP01009310.1.p1  ORF type:complete len:421 (+),score=83.14 GEMP01009310.1:23-1264(+)
MRRSIAALEGSNPEDIIPLEQDFWKLPKKYIVKDQLGAGSYGTVCEGYDELEGRQVAIKRSREIFDDLIDAKRMLREISILARLDNTNIVKLYDLIIPQTKDFDEMYMVMEYADADLLKLLRHGIFLKRKHIEVIAWNMFDGMEYLHRVGIMHRDLKPANILVNLACTVKICDFGLARTFKEAIVPENMNHEEFEGVTDFPQGGMKLKRVLTRHVVTRWYRAPELILLMEDYSEAVDVWSLGCILAELLGMLESVKPKWSDRGAIFPGTSCFPLSPRQSKGKGVIKSVDQLQVIFQMLGTPAPAETKHLGVEAVKYIQTKYKPIRGFGFGAYKSVGDDGVHLLQKLLEFSPSKRISMEDATKHAFFRNCAEKYKFATRSDTEPITLPFDNSNLEEVELRELFFAEAARFQSSK